MNRYNRVFRLTILIAIQSFGWSALGNETTMYSPKYLQFTPLHPANMCPASEVTCNGDDDVFVRAKDGRCACLSQKDFAAMPLSADKCHDLDARSIECRRSQETAFSEKPQFTSLTANNVLVGCGCFETLVGKMISVEGLRTLNAANSTQCKNGTDSSCSNKDRTFLRAHDGRCGCVDAAKLINPNECADIFKPALTQVPVTEPALFFRQAKLIGCGHFGTIR